MASGPNYAEYSDRELVDAFESIDAESYPQRYQSLCELMESKQIVYKSDNNTYTLHDEYAHGVTDDWDESDLPTTQYITDAPEPQYDKDGNYIPNQVPLQARIVNSLFAIVIIAYGSYGVYFGELFVPIARNLSIIIYGPATVIMLLSIIAASLTMIIEIVDHYDTRDNEHTYYKFARISASIGVVSFIAAIVVGFSSGAEIY
ncbi:hypothetical protein PN836_002160 [Ningiella sp. W23]|uniref:hypothetical protein n=1 Tax=Ningiella sp. W23 TaxID=3023715 RepID=UPI0037566196